MSRTRTAIRSVVDLIICFVHSVRQPTRPARTKRNTCSVLKHTEKTTRFNVDTNVRTIFRRNPQSYIFFSFQNRSSSSFVHTACFSQAFFTRDYGYFNSISHFSDEALPILRFFECITILKICSERKRREKEKKRETDIYSSREENTMGVLRSGGCDLVVAHP